MISVLTVENINFEKTISALMPGILQKCRKISKPNLVLRMLLEMEDDALTVLLGIMQRLSEDAKVELLCQLMNGYGEVLTEKFNEYLKKDALGRNFRFQSIYMRKRNNGVELEAAAYRLTIWHFLTKRKSYKHYYYIIRGGRIGYGFSKRTTQNFCGE